jgi:DNA polymerase-1
MGGEVGLDRLPFPQIWAVDFEFVSRPGGRPKPVCLVARELRSGELVRVWQDDLCRLRAPPYPTDSSSLFVAFYAPAELGCHLALGWTMPERILDLYVEHRAATNGRRPPNGRGLLGAMLGNGLESISSQEKSGMIDLILTDSRWSAEERQAILDYCQTDVDALARLLPVMAPRIDIGHALLRGRYMAAVARMEHAGVPVDVNTLGWLRRGWNQIKTELIARVDGEYDVFDGATFKTDRFADYLAREGIA